MRPCPGCSVDIDFIMCCPDCYLRVPDQVPGFDGDWRPRLRTARIWRRWSLAGRIILAVQAWLVEHPVDESPEDLDLTA